MSLGVTQPVGLNVFLGASLNPDRDLANPDSVLPFDQAARRCSPAGITIVRLMFVLRTALPRSSRDRRCQTRSSYLAGLTSLFDDGKSARELESHPKWAS